ncbi:MAG: Nif3-like dinuclear metal center hexameric protein, partial [Thermoflexales bacterium]|nr:Nif3-like dinuclear metal center hexameric protein [Thermoflexales bacterium]
MNAEHLIRHLNAFLAIDRYADRSNNGLQVQCPPEVTRVAFAVDACLASFERAVAWKAQLLIVHHGLFWSEPPLLTGAHFERVRTLICGECGLYA